MAPNRELIPVEPDWRTVVTTLYTRYGTYDKLLDALGEHGGSIADHSTLCKLRSGKCKLPTWRTGAALLNLYSQIK